MLSSGLCGPVPSLSWKLPSPYQKLPDIANLRSSVDVPAGYLSSDTSDLDVTFITILEHQRKNLRILLFVSSLLCC